MSDVFPWSKIPHAHELMRTNMHPPGNMAVLINAPREGLRTLDYVIRGGGEQQALLAKPWQACSNISERSDFGIKLLALSREAARGAEKPPSP